MREVIPEWRASSQAKPDDESIIEVRRIGRSIEIRERHRVLGTRTNVMYAEVTGLKKFIEAVKRGEFDDLADEDHPDHQSLAELASEVIKTLRYGNGIPGLQGTRWNSGPC